MMVKTSKRLVRKLLVKDTIWLIEPIRKRVCNGHVTISGQKHDIGKNRWIQVLKSQSDTRDQK